MALANLTVDEIEQIDVLKDDTVDEQNAYSVVIAGLADNGKIIRKEAKLWRQNDESDTLKNDTARTFGFVIRMD